MRQERLRKLVNDLPNELFDRTGISRDHTKTNHTKTHKGQEVVKIHVLKGRARTHTSFVRTMIMYKYND